MHPLRCRKSIWIIRLVCACAALLAAVGCRRPAEPLRFGLNPWPGYEFIRLAEKLGYFAEEGVEVRLVEFASLGDSRRAYERGQVHGVATTVAEVVLSGANAARPLRIVAAADYSTGADAVLARPAIADAAALRGRRVGVESGSLAVYVLARALETAGLGLGDVTMEPGDLDTLADAYRRGKIDAIVAYPPYSTGLLRDGSARVVFDSSQIPGEVLDVLAFGAETVRDRPEDIAAFLRAFHRAQEAHVRDPQATEAIMAAHMAISPEEFSQALNKEMHVVGREEQAEALAEERLKGVLTRVSALFVRVGLIERELVPGGFYTRQFVEGAGR